MNHSVSHSPDTVSHSPNITAETEQGRTIPDSALSFTEVIFMMTLTIHGTPQESMIYRIITRVSSGASDTGEGRLNGCLL